MLYRNVRAGLTLKKIEIVGFSSLEISQATSVFSCATQSFQTGHKFLIGWDDFCFHKILVGQEQSVLLWHGKLSVFREFFLKDIQHIAAVGIPDKRTALCQDPVQCGVTHKKTRFGFLFLKFQDAPKVWADGGEKSEIVGDITFFIKGIFRQKHRKLSLNTKTWTKGFLKQIIVTQ